MTAQLLTDERGDAAERVFDRRADWAHDNGHDGRANRLQRQGDRIKRRL